MAPSDSRQLLLPPLGEVENAELLEFSVEVGDSFTAGQVVALIESDKATLEVPAPRAGEVLALKAQAGDSVQEGSCLFEYRALEDAPGAEAPAAAAEPAAAPPPAAPAPSAPPAVPAFQPAPAASTATAEGRPIYAGPAVRRLARQLGAALDQVRGTGPRGRVHIEDLHAWVREQLQKGAGLDWPATPWPDLAQYGPVEVEPVGRIARISAERLYASWVNIPHVTQEDEAEVSEMEALRRKLKPEAAERGTRLTPLAFILQACVRALETFPLFRSALAPGGRERVRRDYYHLGIAVDTPKGLVVPVLRDLDRLDLYQTAAECARLAEIARAGKLRPEQMSGGVFTVSSLGHIGGTGFTPVINAPEVAILGVSAMQDRLVPGEKGEPVLAKLLPLSLSYDHRVVNGVDAVTFTRAIADHLSRPETLLTACREADTL